MSKTLKTICQGHEFQIPLPRSETGHLRHARGRRSSTGRSPSR